MPTGTEIIILLVVLTLLAAPALLVLVVLQRTSRRDAPAFAAAAWYPDPTGRHEHRYFDGRSWTSAVSDRGIAADDPLP